ncbi:3-isopropylmalate dehydratase large subunit [Pimelobacter simplex]|uniref:3-isopropylmalate dehydratase large subunit n=1 Tax=Nocardioides simplex TaxID=2045 RepID=A0A7J5E2Q7_NOCSI|nr:3-isopropylmalate dehydratase large subunit [Pimelobacter simplex]KAB2812551.1 3-isopropylmalate dehydratase large subunit [Pimelobacter simplex]
MGARTLLDRLWDDHVVVRGDGDGAPDLLYVDLHLLHEMTSPQAFAGLRAAGRGVRRPDLTVATEDHNVPTTRPLPLSLLDGVTDPLSRLQMETVRRNCAEFGVPHHPLGSAGNGIVHVIGPEQGLSQPGLSIVCGDSHTSTHGALGSLAFGIGTSQVEHVLATQTLWMERPRSLEVRIDGVLGPGVSAKDLALHVVRAIGVNGGAGSVLELRGSCIDALTVEQRMTLCNMSIECGARGGLIAPDATTLAYLAGRPFAPTGAAWEAATAYWRTLRSDDDAVFDRSVVIDAADVVPTVTWGTNPSQAVAIDDVVPTPAPDDDVAARALAYMGLSPGTPMRAIAVDTVFIGSCTNGRLEDLRAAADVVRASGRPVAPGVRALVVPGSAAVVRAAEAEGLDRVFTGAGFEWRGSGCSMCTAMNPDALGPGVRSASTTNRNFEGRQGDGARTHLVSPPVAAATALVGRLAAPVDL